MDEEGQNYLDNYEDDNFDILDENQIDKVKNANYIKAENQENQENLPSNNNNLDTNINNLNNNISNNTKSEQLNNEYIINNNPQQIKVEEKSNNQNKENSKNLLNEANINDNNTINDAQITQKENPTNVATNSGNLNNDNFLENSIIGDIYKNLENLDNLYKSKINDEAIEIRIKQLAYSKLLVNIYEKDVKYLIIAYTNLGTTYLDYAYYEQAQEHLLNAFKLNEGIGENQTDELKEIQIKILINLAKCYLASNKANPAISISEKCLKMNQTLKGEDNISNTDIYYVLAKGHSEMRNFKTAVEYFSKMFAIFEQVYGFDSEKCAKVCMELGQIYEISNNLPDAIEYFKFAWEIWDKILKNSPNDEGHLMVVDVAIKLGELMEKSGNPSNSYEILKACEKKYGFTYENKKKKCIDIKKLLTKYCELSQDLDNNYIELVSLEVRYLKYFFFKF